MSSSARTLRLAESLLAGLISLTVKLAGAGLFLSLAYLWAGDLGLIAAFLVILSMMTA